MVANMFFNLFLPRRGGALARPLFLFDPKITQTMKSSLGVGTSAGHPSCHRMLRIANDNMYQESDLGSRHGPGMDLEWSQNDPNGRFWARLALLGTS